MALSVKSMLKLKNFPRKIWWNEKLALPLHRQNENDGRKTNIKADKV